MLHVARLVKDNLITFSKFHNTLSVSKKVMDFVALRVKMISQSLNALIKFATFFPWKFILICSCNKMHNNITSIIIIEANILHKKSITTYKKEEITSSKEKMAQLRTICFLNSQQ
jgi:hypothetical protein